MEYGDRTGMNRIGCGSTPDRVRLRERSAGLARRPRARWGRASAEPASGLLPAPMGDIPQIPQGLRWREAKRE